MKVMRYTGFFLGVMAGFILYRVAYREVQKNELQRERDFVFYFGMEYPRGNAIRRAELRRVTGILTDMRSELPDTELANLDRQIESTLWRMGEPKGFDRLFMLLTRRELFMNEHLAEYGHFARACRVARRVFATDTLWHGAIQGADSMLRGADCPKEE